MSANPDSTERGPHTDSSPGAETRDPSQSGHRAAAASAGPVGLLATAFGAALLAAFLAWGVGEKMYAYYRPSKAAYRGRYDFSALNREQAIADRKNAMIAYGAFGALLGSLVGAAGGLARRSATATFKATFAGLLGGGIGGALAAYGLAPLFVRYYSDYNPLLLLPVAVRGGTCAVIGAAAGLAIGLGKCGPAGVLRSILGGLFGGLLGIIVFECVNAPLFPMDRNDNAIPTTTAARLLCYLCVAVGVAAGAVFFGRDRSRQAIEDLPMAP